MSSSRSPGVKLVLAAFVAGALLVPLLMVYALIYDRESQSQLAQAQITAGWGGPQIVTGPVLVLPYVTRTSQTVTDAQGQQTTTSNGRAEIFISPTSQSIATTISPDRKGYAIYESVVFESTMRGTARFDWPTELARLGIDPADALPSQAHLRFGVSDPRGLKHDAAVSANDEPLQLNPGGGPMATAGAGFSAFLDWSGRETLIIAWEYGVRGSQTLDLIPRGGETAWAVTSPWPHPSFAGSFLPDAREISGSGFTARYAGISNLALGQPLVSLTDFAAPADSSPPVISDDMGRMDSSAVAQSPALLARIGLVDPVDLYSQVDRAVKYGFLFIGFTFATFLMFDIVGGARVAAAEYLLSGAGLVLFFVLLLALAEVVGFGLAYVLAAMAIIGLLTTYSAAVLGTWKRASFIGTILAGLYGLLYVLLNMETYALLIGAMLLFVTLAGIMYATRRVDWSGARAGLDPDEVTQAQA